LRGQNTDGRINAVIYPEITQDGIRTYIRNINKFLDLPVMPCRSHILSPRQFLGGVPKGFDLVHVPNFLVPLNSGNAKIVCTIQDIIPIVARGNLNMLQEQYVHFRIRWSVKKADHLIFTSESTLRDVEMVFGKVKSYSVIPLGVDDPISSDQIPGSPYPFPYFFSVGRRRKHKNIEGILRAFAQAMQGTEARIVFGGKEDIHDADWRRLAQNLGIGDRVRFSGFLTREELAAHYHHALGLVFPSLYEGFGLPILEAMSYGCPVIASNLSSMPEVAGEAALLVDPHDHKAIAGAMVRMARENDLREKLIEKGHANLKRFSWETTARRTAEVYNRLLAGSFGKKPETLSARKVTVYG